MSSFTRKNYEPYNGFVNYETWLVMLYLDNTYDDYLYVQKLAKRKLSNYRLARILKSVYDRNTFNAKFDDYMTYREYQVVQWMDIAKSINSEYQLGEKV